MKTEKQTIEVRIGKQRTWADCYATDDEPNHKIVMFEVSPLTPSPVINIQYAFIYSYSAGSESEAEDYEDYRKFKRTKENDLLKIVFENDKSRIKEALTKISPGWPSQMFLFNRDAEDEKGFTDPYNSTQITSIENLTQGWKI